MDTKELIQAGKKKISGFKVYTVVKDLIILAGIVVLAYGLYIGYELVHKNREQLMMVERNITELGTGISIDNQRKAKIAKGADMITMTNPAIPYEIAMNYSEWFVDESDKYQNVDFVLLISIAAKESKFDYKAKSPVGARGLMQLMPGTAMDMCEYLRMSYADTIRTDPRTNIRLGARYVNKLMTLFNNDTSAVIAAYNGGEGSGARYKQGLPLFDETTKYIPAVHSYKKKFGKLL